MSSIFQTECADILYSKFPMANIEENIRPEWLLSDNNTRLELDLYLPDMEIAFEIQGRQHYVFVESFHKTYDEFERQKARDAQKKKICEQQGVKLFLIDSTEEMEWVVASLKIKCATEEQASQRLLPSDTYNAKTRNRSKNLVASILLKESRVQRKLQTAARFQKRLYELPVGHPEIQRLSEKIARWKITAWSIQSEVESKRALFV